MTIITRRAALGGIAAFSAAGAGVGAPADAAGTAIDRIEKLAAELAQALDEFCGDQFKAEVYPTGHRRFPAQLRLLSALEMSPEESVEHHLARAVDAASDLGGSREWDMGPWHYSANAGAVLAIRMDTIRQGRSS